MADNTPIEWADATWNPITGCSVVSPGCTNCYAMRLAGTRMKYHHSRQGLTRDTKAGPVWTGEVRFNKEWLDQPLRWSKPRRIFVCAHGDLFAEGVPDEWIDRVFAVMALAPQHTFLVLTKRAERMREYLTARNGMGNVAICRAINAIPAGLGNRHGALEMPLPNVIGMVSAEDQRRADERLPDLLDTPLAKRGVSLEPLLGPIDLTRIPSPVVTPEDEGFYHSALQIGDIHFRDGDPDMLTGRKIVDAVDGPMMDRLDWVIVGGESGPNARPMHPDWARSLRDQCQAAGIPFFFKQWGGWIDADDWFDRVTKYRAIASHDGDWAPSRPLNYADAERLAAITHHDFTEHQSDGTTLIRVGKKAAGGLLDGIEHNRFPI